MRILKVFLYDPIRVSIILSHTHAIFKPQDGESNVMFKLRTTHPAALGIFGSSIHGKIRGFVSTCWRGFTALADDRWNNQTGI